MISSDVIKCETGRSLVEAGIKHLRECEVCRNQLLLDLMKNPIAMFGLKALGLSIEDVKGALQHAEETKA